MAAFLSEVNSTVFFFFSSLPIALRLGKKKKRTHLRGKKDHLTFTLISSFVFPCSHKGNTQCVLIFKQLTK